MKPLIWLGIFAGNAASFVACSSETTIATTVSSTGSASGSSTTTSSSTSTSSSTTSSSSGAGGGMECGGLHGIACPMGSFCRYDACPGPDQLGRCAPVPDCSADFNSCPGACGCDGQSYCNECVAYEAGVDVDHLTKKLCVATSCADAASAIAAATSGQACTTVLRADAATAGLIAYDYFCGPMIAVDEAAAWAAAVKAGFPNYMPPPPSQTGPTPGNVFVFGGMFVPDDTETVLVSARNGLALFHIQNVAPFGNGTIKYPSTWKSAAELGAGCMTQVAEPPLSGEGDLTQAKAALHAIWQTALPIGIPSGATILDAYAQNARVSDHEEIVIFLSSGVFTK